MARDRAGLRTVPLGTAIEGTQDSLRTFRSLICGLLIPVTERQQGGMTNDKGGDYSIYFLS